MSKLAASLLVLGILACGDRGGDGASSGMAAEPAPGSAGSSALQDCVDLVQAERYPEAVTRCQTALEQDPTNSAARLALQRAQRAAP